MNTETPPPPAIIWPAPKEEIPSPDFTLEASGKPVFVYQARVRAKLLEKPGLWSHETDPAGERASFAIFDIAGPVTVTIRPSRPFRTASLWPAKAGIQTVIDKGTVTFTVAQPRHLTLLLDGSDVQPLHLFIGAPETDVPKPDDPDCLYFGPGTHVINQLKVKDGQTVYLAGGAVVKAALAPDDKGTYSEKWHVTFHNGSSVGFQGVKHAALRGRGILDGSLVPHPGHNLMRVWGSKDIRLEGVTLRDAPNWNVSINESEDVRVDDLRIISGRLNSDGINSCNSQRIAVRGCFVRNHDDSIVVKTLSPGKPAQDIAVDDCTIWADWGFGLGITYETRSPITRVRFRDCAIVYARHWCLGVRVCDGSLISDVSFENLEIGDFNAMSLGGSHNALTKKPMLLWMGIVKDIWGNDPEAGFIKGVRLENVTVFGPAIPPSEILGFDAAHPVEDVLLRTIRLAGKPPAADAAALGLRTNAFTRTVRVEP
jgi:hypothetical protein